ncbi:MAG: DUF6705 family protein [Nitritalea sp.]
MVTRGIVVAAFVLCMTAPLFGQHQVSGQDAEHKLAELEGTWKHESQGRELTIKFVPVYMKMGPVAEAEVRDVVYGYILYEDNDGVVMDQLHEIGKYETNQFMSFESYMETPKDKIPQFLLSVSPISNKISGSFSLHGGEKYFFSIEVTMLDNATIKLKSHADHRNEADLTIFPKEISELTFIRVE